VALPIREHQLSYWIRLLIKCLEVKIIMVDKKMKYEEYIEENTLRCEASYRGGGIEIDVSSLFGEDCKMSAYQNYLGGGMLGSIQSNCNFDTESLSEAKQKKCFDLADELKRYFHNLTNHEDDEWESQTYDVNQSMPTSAY